MKSQNIKLNMILSVIIIVLVIYFTYLKYENEKNIIKEGNIGRKIKKAVTKQVAKQVTKIIKPIEKTLKNQVKVAITQSTKPIKKTISGVKNIIKKITRLVANIIKGLKNGIVKPIKDAFKYIGLMFAQIGLLIFDFLQQIVQIPTCLISYIIWIVIKLKDEVIQTIILPIIKKILKKIFGRFYPETIVNYFLKFMNWFIDFHFYILSSIGSFFGINNLFYKEKCFNFTGKFKKKIKNMEKHLKKAGSSFKDFGKMGFK